MKNSQTGWCALCNFTYIGRRNAWRDQRL